MDHLHRQARHLNRLGQGSYTERVLGYADLTGKPLEAASVNSAAAVNRDRLHLRIV